MKLTGLVAITRINFLVDLKDLEMILFHINISKEIAMTL